MSTSDAASPEHGPLSVDEAVELLAGADESPEAADEAEPSGDFEEHEQEQGDLDPPHFWSAEDKAAFAELPPHLQARIAAYEKNRDDATARVIQEAAEARNRAAAEAEEIAALNAQLAEALPRAQTAFVQAWGHTEPNWLQMAQTHGQEVAGQMKQRFDHDVAQMRQLHASAQEGQARAFETYVAAEFEKLKVVEPELADPARGEARLQAVGRFLLESGFDADQIRHAGAQEMAIAYDALRYRQAKAGMSASQRAPAARPGLRPAAAQPQSSSHRRAESIRSRFAAAPTIDNAVAAILAKG